MTDKDHQDQLLSTVQEFHRIVESGFRESREAFYREIGDLRKKNDADHADIHERIDASNEKQTATAHKVAGIHGWAAGAAFVGGAIASAIAWFISHFGAKP